MGIFTLFSKRFPGHPYLLALLLSILNFFPIFSYSQVIETETENVMPHEIQEVKLSDSARALLTKYQQQHSLPLMNVQPLVTNCPNSEFNNGTFSNWTGGWGFWEYSTSPWYSNELDTNTVAPYPHYNNTPIGGQCYNLTPLNETNCPPLHSIIPAPGTWDPNTGDSLITVYPGEVYSSRLGHNVGGYHKSQLKYNIFVDNSTYLFIYRYAVVLQVPTQHTAIQQPSFSIEIQDSTGAVIDSTCGYYYIWGHVDPITLQAIPPWHKHWTNVGTGDYDIWKDWATVGMNLAPYQGHHVSIVFTSKDCSLGAHFGYAYLSAFCNHIRIQTSMCVGDTSATLTAPPGFSYFWNTGDTTISIVVPHPVDGALYSCRLTSANGCQVMIYDTLTYTLIHANFTHGPACAGVVTQFTDSTTINQNSVIEWNWDFGDASPPVTGIPNPTHVYAALGTYNVTLIATSSEGCPDTIIKSIVVDSMPAITNTILRQQICSNGTTSIFPTSNLSNTLYTWTVSTSSHNITGYFNNQSIPGPFINQTLVNSGIQIDSVTYHITPHKGSCTGEPVDFVVVISSPPYLTTTPLQYTQCDSLSTNIILQSSIPGSTFTWTASGSSANVAGFSNSYGPVISQTLINSGFNNETVTYSVTPINNGCLGNITNITVTVFPKADVYFTPSGEAICSSQSTNLILASHVALPSFNWTATGSSGNVSGYFPGTGNSIIQTLTNSGTVDETVTYTATPSTNGCQGSPGSESVIVYSPPIVSYQLCHDNITTIASQPIRLMGGIPLGGNYTGIGVTANLFTPSLAGIGNHVITYTFTNYLGCPNTATQLITVVNVPMFSCGSKMTDIRDNLQYNTVNLAGRCWMSENLNFGSEIAHTEMQRDNCINEKYCYNDNTSNCSANGGLYQWDEMMRYNNLPAAQGFCPPAWHVPTENEWNALFALYVNNGFAGSPLKYSGFSGFDAFLSGVRFNNVNWSFSDFAIMFWSSTEEITNKAWAHGMNTINPSVSFYPSSKTNAFPVRCIKD